MRACFGRVRGGAAVSASLLALAIGARAARASALELEFASPAPCPTEEIAFRVGKALAQPVAGIAGPTFRVRIEQVASGFEGWVDASRPGDAGRESRERRVTAGSCDELVDTLALALVLAIGSQRDANEAAREASAPHAGEPPESIAGAAAGQSTAGELGPSPVEPNGGGPQRAAFGSLLADTGTLPASGLGVALGVDVAWTSIELRALGTWLPEREGLTDPGDPASPGADIGLLAGGLLVCAPLSTRAVGAVIVACLGGELGRLSGHGTRVDSSHSSATWWLAPRADIAGRWALPLRWLALELGITAAAPIWRDDFVLQGIGSVHRPANVVGRASLSLRASFGQ